MGAVSGTIRTAALASLIASSAFASDWYVDAVGGNNANSGTSALQAWKTITFAVANTPQAGAQTIHVAPGTYDTTLGEAFPWVWRPALALVGDMGSSVTHIVGTPGNPVLSMESFAQGNGWSFGNDTLIQGLDFQTGSLGISINSNWGPVSPTLSGIKVSGMGTTGIRISTFGAGAAQPLLDNVAISNCPTGLGVSGNGSGGTVATVTDSSFSGNSLNGIYCVAGATLNLSLERCSVVNSGSFGVILSGYNYGWIEATMHATTIAHNVGGIWGQTGALYFTTRTSATQCTIADNGSIGVQMDSGGPSNSAIQLDSCIIHGHTDDLAVTPGTFPAASTVRYCEIGDGEYAGAQGNFQADPRFVNAPAGDYNLLADSPCIDAADPALPFEGDCTRADVGALHFAHTPWTPYCTAKQNSCGSLPVIGASGVASATASSGFIISASGAKALKPGLLLYSTAGRAALPFGGGFLCVAAPVRRSTAVIDISGTPGQCDGVLSLDMNAFAAGSLGGNPLPALRVAGTQVDCQYWGRDTAASSLLSDALEYFVCQ